MISDVCRHVILFRYIETALVSRNFCYQPRYDLQIFTNWVGAIHLCSLWLLTLSHVDHRKRSSLKRISNKIQLICIVSSKIIFLYITPASRKQCLSIKEKEIIALFLYCEIILRKLPSFKRLKDMKVSFGTLSTDDIKIMSQR